MNDAFFDELTKISKSLSEVKGSVKNLASRFNKKTFELTKKHPSAAAGIAGGTFATHRSINKEQEERANDKRFRLSPDEERAARKKRLRRHIRRVATTAAGAATLAHGVRKAYGNDGSNLRDFIVDKSDMTTYSQLVGKHRALSRFNDELKAAKKPGILKRIGKKLTPAPKDN